MADQTTASEAEAKAAAAPQTERIPGLGEYLGAKERRIWFRRMNPEGKITVYNVALDVERGYACFHAHVVADNGACSDNVGSAYRDVLEEAAKRRRANNPAEVAWDFAEFAATAAVSRALSDLGYGTEDALGDLKVADAPRNRPEQAGAAPAPYSGAGSWRDEPASEGKRKAIFAVARAERGAQNSAEVVALVRQWTGKDVNDLTSGEASELLDKMKDKGVATPNFTSGAQAAAPSAASPVSSTAAAKLEVARTAVAAEGRALGLTDREIGTIIGMVTKKMTAAERSVGDYANALAQLKKFPDADDARYYIDDPQKWLVQYEFSLGSGAAADQKGDFDSGWSALDHPVI
jgi:hypothetical protein